MLPSIKESDRYTVDERILLALAGILLTILAVVFTILQGVISYHTAVFLIAGPGVVCKACCGAGDKGKIRVVSGVESKMACPRCLKRGLMECYKENVGTVTQRRCHIGYTEVRKTTTWARKVHCRSCGYKDGLSTALGVAGSISPALTETSDSPNMMVPSNGTAEQKKGATAFFCVQIHKIQEELAFTANNEGGRMHPARCEEEGMELIPTEKEDSSLNVVV